MFTGTEIHRAKELFQGRIGDHIRSVWRLLGDARRSGIDQWCLGVRAECWRQPRREITRGDIEHGVMDLLRLGIGEPCLFLPPELVLKTLYKAASS